MAISQVGSATHATSPNGANVTVSKPTGVAAGDVLIAYGCTTETTPYFDTTPSGWSVIATSASGDTPGLFQARAWYRVAGGSEPANYTWGSSGASGAGAPIVVTVTAWRGVDNSTPIGNSAVTAGGAISSGVNPNPTIGFTQTSGLAKQIYMRAVRSTSAIPTFTVTQSGWTELDDVGDFSGGSVRYSILSASRDAESTNGTSCSEPSSTANAATTDEAYILIALTDSVTGTAAMTLGSVTEAFTGSSAAFDASLSMTLGSVTADMAGTHFPPAVGDIDMDLPSVSIDASGDSTGGPMSVTLPSVSASFAGSVNPIGSFGMTLSPISLDFTAETRPFGAQVIQVEREKRGLLVIQDDPGLLSVYAAPQLATNALVEATVSATAFGASVTASARPGAVSASSSVSAPASQDAEATPGSASASGSANAATVI